MAEYIDRDKALEEFDEWVESTGVLPKGTSYYAEARGCIECVPAADVEPVVHAHWKNSNPKCPFSAYCSNCRANALCDYLGDEILSDRCPNCGAKMDGEVTQDG